LTSFVGKVKYEGTQTLLAMLKDENIMNGKIFDQSGWGQASTFFFKRIAFRHEREIRIIYNHQNNSNADIFKFDIDFKLLILNFKLLVEFTFIAKSNRSTFYRMQ
jgi:hypothetical protein